jgi:hypothetical protein
MTVDEHPAEERESLWLLTLSPLIWTAHFLLSYLTAAIWCAKVAGSGGALNGVRVAIALYTLLALAGIGVITWLGFRRHTFGTTTAAHDFDSPAGRHGFLGFAVVLLSVLSAIATIYVALPAVFIGTCR